MKQNFPPNPHIPGNPLARPGNPDRITKTREDDVVNTGILFVFRGFSGFLRKFGFTGFSRISSDFSYKCFTIVLPGLKCFTKWS